MSEGSLKFIIDDVKQSNAVSNQTSSPASHVPSSYSSNKHRKRRRHHSHLLVWLIVFLVVVALSVSYLYNDHYLKGVKYVPIGVGQSFVDAENNLGIKIINDAYTQGLRSNMVIAPSGLDAPLSFVYTNTNPTNARNLKRLLSYGGMSNSAIRMSNQIMLNSLVNPDGSTLRLNSNLWVNGGSIVKSAYLKDAKSNFDMPVSNLDFSKPSAIASINARIRQDVANGSINAGGLIGKQQSALITNSAYFTDQWQYGFNYSQTKAAQFSSLSGSSLTVPFMHQTNVFNYYANADLEAIQLPFGADGSLVMNVYMPSDFQSFMSGLSLKDLADINSNFNQYKIDLSLPRLNINYQANLDTVLKSLGASSLFDSNLSNQQINPPVHLTDFLTFNHLNVSEQGVSTTLQSAANNTAAMTVNKPFLFTIVDNSTGNFVMIGIVSNPSQ